MKVKAFLLLIYIFMSDFISGIRQPSVNSASIVLSLGKEL